MPDLLDEVSRILAARLPRRDAIRLLSGMVTTSALGRYLPLAKDEGEGKCKNIKLCGDCCDKNGHGKDCTGNNICFCPQETTCCGNGGPGKTRCCGSDHRFECCEKRTGEGCCCPRNDSDCDHATGECILHPDIKVDKYKQGPPVQIEIGVTDRSGRGLSSITVDLLVNATVDIPELSPGTSFAVVTATKLDQKLSSRIVLRACSFGCAVGDPVLTELQIEGSDRHTEERFPGISADERFITLQNGAPGLRRVEILVNDRPATTRWLRDRSIRTIDIAPFLRNGDNDVTVVAQGRPGSKALILITDTPGPDSGAKRFHPLIEWKPGTADPDANLHWGN